MSFLLGGQRAANKPPPSLTPKEPVKSAKAAPVKKVEDVVTHQPVAQQPPPQPNANEHHTEPTPGPIPAEQQATVKPKDEKQSTTTTKPHQSVFIKEVKLHKNGDATVPPAIYTYHSKEGHSFDEVLGHMGKLVPPKNGQPANALYTHEGQKITNLTQLADVNEDHFVVAHGEYEPVQGGYLKPAAHNLHRDPPKHHTEEPEPTSGEKVPSKQTRPKSSKPQKQTDPPKSNNNDQQSDDKIGVIKRFYVYRCGDPKYKAHTYVYRSRHVRSNWDALCEDLTKVAPPIHGGHVVKLFTVDGEEEITHVSQLEPNLDYVACGVDGYVDVHGGYEKIGHRDGTVAKQGAGGRQTPIYRRKDQTNPENIMIYVFRNGQGIDSHMFTYKKKELDKGLAWIKEKIGHKLQTNGKRLCTVDGQEVMHTNDLINKGCYILVPAHEKFREDTYYYLPEAAVDTSGEAEEHSPDHHEQKQERREKPRESRPKSSKPQRNESAPPSRNQSRAASPSDYQSEYEDSVRSATPVSRYDSDPEDPFPHKHNNKNDSRSAGTSPIRTLAIPPTKHQSRAKTPAGRTRHQSVSPIPSQQYRDPLEPFDHNIPSTKPHRQQQPTPQRNFHPQQQFPQQQYPQQQFPQQQFPQQQYPQQQFPQQQFPQQQQQFPPRQQQPNVNRNRPQTAFDDPENEYGNRPEWVNPDKIRSVLEESDLFKNQSKPEPRKKPNEQLPYGRRPVTQQRQPQGQHQQQQQPRPQQTQRQQQPQPQFYPQQQYSDLEPEPVTQPQPLRQPYKPPAPVHKPAPVAPKPAPQKPLATVPKPTPHQPVRRRSDNDVFYAKEPTQLSLRRGPVDLDKDPGGIFKAKKATENPISKPQRQPTGKASLRQPPPAKVNHKDNKYTKDLTAYYY